ncbi:Cro/CI family transcriptional regulator [Pseudomonas frederiksbergensis]|uniref:Cro/CI family transcriptional regulator n=1 Tax=Pseudomonas frederiksbergensis TaxID=104087 RepID=UPI0023B861E8|nr:Cro/CI family transcriptional regulator [Pseudomonas frederiksbergensis]
MSLSDLVQRMGQAPVARALGVKPASIAKALRTHRNITVTIGDDGSCAARETRPFPSQEYSGASDGPKSSQGKALGQPKCGELP